MLNASKATTIGSRVLLPTLAGDGREDARPHRAYPPHESGYPHDHSAMGPQVGLALYEYTPDASFHAVDPEDRSYSHMHDIMSYATLP